MSFSGHFRLRLQLLVFTLCTLFLVSQLSPCLLPRTSSLTPSSVAEPLAHQDCLHLGPVLKCSASLWGAPGNPCGTLAVPPTTCHSLSAHCTACKLAEHLSVSTSDSHPSPWNRFSFQIGSTNLENVPSQTHYCPLGLSSHSEREQRESFSNKRLRPLPSPKYP